jgi:branched-chain amino acid transport system ATP-binding protein
MITLRGVFAGYGGGDVLQGVDLTVAAGSVTCVLGPNGAGKSTLLRVVSGLLRPRIGSVLLGERRIDGLSVPSILAAGVAQVPQTGALFPRMSVRENVLLGGYLIRRDRRLLAERYAMVASLVPDVVARADVPAGNLSGGQRRMVEIGRSLMLDPAVILLDEPSLGLDPRSLAAVAELITGMRRTVVLVEQNVRLGLSLSTHGVVMEGGRVRLQGSAQEVLDHPEVASLYLGGLPTAPGGSPSAPVCEPTAQAPGEGQTSG